MRSEEEFKRLLLDTARADERIRAVLLGGSRANPAVPRDPYQDYDVVYIVTDMRPFTNNPAWVTERFGQPLIMQMPEAMRNPVGGGHFNYMMVYPDGIRLDLTFDTDYSRSVEDGEPAIVWLDKDDGRGRVPRLPPPSDAIWHIRPPSPLDYYSCCNNFWWCLNNVAKGIARDELAYVMHMLNEVRGELHDMIDWTIGIRHDFRISVGKNGKYYRTLLPPELYAQYAATYRGSGTDGLWAAVDGMCGLFHTLATAVAPHFGFTYRQNEEDGIRTYLEMVKSDGSAV